jgi:hypothetical protein
MSDGSERFRSPAGSAEPYAVNIDASAPIERVSPGCLGTRKNEASKLGARLRINRAPLPLGVVVPWDRGRPKKISELKSLPDSDPGAVTAHRWRKRFCCKLGCELDG